MLRASETAARPSTPACRFHSAVAVDTGGYVFISDFDDYFVRMVTPNGIITTVAGGGPCLQPADAGLNCALGDGGPATGAILGG